MKEQGSGSGSGDREARCGESGEGTGGASEGDRGRYYARGVDACQFTDAWGRFTYAGVGRSAWALSGSDLFFFACFGHASYLSVGTVVTSYALSCIMLTYQFCPFCPRFVLHMGGILSCMDGVQYLMASSTCTTPPPDHIYPI